MSDEDRWKIAQSHMSGYIPLEPDPDAAVRDRASAAVGYRVDQHMTDARSELARNGGALAVLHSAVQRADVQMKQSESAVPELNRQAAILKQKLRSGGGQ